MDLNSLAGVLIGSAVTLFSQFVYHFYTTQRERKLFCNRKKLLKKMLEKPGPSGWRKMETMSNVIGASRNETAALLIELGCRRSEKEADVWAFIKDKPLPDGS